MTFSSQSLALALAVAMGTTEADLQRAKALVQVELRYAEGIDHLSRILIRSDLSAAERVEAYRLLGIAHIALGHGEEAEAALWELFRLEPELEIDPQLSPKVLQVFERARERAQRAPRLTNIGVELRGRTLRFSGMLHDPHSKVADVILYVRAPNGAYREQQMEIAGEEISATLLPVNPSVEQTVQYYLIGRAADGRTVARLATPAGPSTVIVHGVLVAAENAAKVEPPEPWYAHWWVWTVAGVLVAGAVTTAILLSQDSEPSAPAGTLDPPITLE